MERNCKLELLSYDPKTKRIKKIKIDLLKIRQITEEFENNKIENIIKSIMKNHFKE